MLLVFMLIAAFLIAFALTWGWLGLARQRAWLDRPNVRSSHQVPTPLGGGMGIVVAFLALWVWQHQTINARELLVIAAAVMLAVVGLIDDFYRLGIRVRLLLQLLAVALLWPMLLELPVLVLPFSISLHGTALALLLSLAIFWLVNLYNFMDGIDALAATEAVFVCIAMAGLAVLAGFPALDPAVLFLGAAAAGFLFFNLPPARIFMGDAGS
jgi:Fuc2NAc and GlcNAc transferase